jgi:hypothetical protein
MGWHGYDIVFVPLGGTPLLTDVAVCRRARFADENSTLVLDVRRNSRGCPPDVAIAKPR